MRVENIINFLNPISYTIHKSEIIGNVKSIFDSSFSTISFGWCSDKNIDVLSEIKSGTILISEETEKLLIEANNDILFNRIVVENPRKSFATVLREFFVAKKEFGKIHDSAIIHETVLFNKETINIGPNVVIEEHVSLGDFVSIDANTVIKSNTLISNNVNVGCNCTIGGVGFGYELNEEGIYELIPHLGNVVLNDKVEIGNNVCIDRAVLGSTILESEVKVDNLVHIAHGVKIGSNSLVIAHSMIAGSVQIGENTWISPCSSIKQKLQIGNNALIGMGSVVIKNVEDNTVVVGVPARKIN